MRGSSLAEVARAREYSTKSRDIGETCGNGGSAFGGKLCSFSAAALVLLCAVACGTSRQPADDTSTASVTSESPSTTYSVTARIPIKDPMYLDVSPDGRSIYVAAWNTTQISVIDATSRQVFSVPVYADSLDIAATEEWVYVATFGGPDDLIIMVDRATHTAKHKIAINDANVLAHDEHGNLYVLAENALRLVDAASGQVSEPIRTGEGPRDIAIDPQGFVFVSNWGSDSVSVVDASARKVVATIPAGKGPGALAFDPKTRWLYAVNHDADTVTVIDIESRTIIDTLHTEDAPNAIAIDPEKRAVYFGYKTESNNVTVLDADTRQVTATIEVSRSIDAMAVDVRSHSLYAVHNVDDYISVVEPN